MNRKEKRGFRFFRADKNGLRNEAIAYKNMCLASKDPEAIEFAKKTKILELHLYTRNGIAQLRAKFQKLAQNAHKRKKEKKK